MSKNHIWDVAHERGPHVLPLMKHVWSTPYRSTPDPGIWTRFHENFLGSYPTIATPDLGHITSDVGRSRPANNDFIWVMWSGQCKL